MRAQITSRIIACTLLIVSVFLLWYSLNVGVMIGADWFGKDATFQWHMNNYIVMDARYAYSIFGLATMVIGGLATGLSMPAFFMVTKTTKHILCLIFAFFVAIVMTGLGFNTLDFMLGSFYWTNMQYPPPVQVIFFGNVDVWNFYFYFFVLPLWSSGFIMGLASSVYAYNLNHIANFFFAKKKVGDMRSHFTKEKEYIVESNSFSRNRKQPKPTFQKIN